MKRGAAKTRKKEVVSYSSTDAENYSTYKAMRSAITNLLLAANKKEKKDF